MITAHDRPRLREDLVAEAIEDRGARFIDVIDPDNGNSYRFYDVEYALACAMDGQRDIPGLVRWAQEELGIAPTPGELQTVIATLGDLGYLDRVDTAAAEPGLAAAVRAAPAMAPASGIEVELGRFQAKAPAVAAPVAPGASEVELGAAGGSDQVIEIEDEDEAPELSLGPSGGSQPVQPAAAAQPVPPMQAARPGSQPAIHPRSKSETLRGEGRLSEPVITAQPRRGSEKQVRPVPAQPAKRPSEPGAPMRRSEPKVRDAGLGVSDPSLSLSLPIRPDDVKEAVRASREMRSVDVPPELMQALEAAEQPAGPASVPPRGRPATAPPVTAATPPPRSEVRSSAVTSTAQPSAAILDPIAPLSGAPLSVSEPISPPSVPPLVPAPRADSRSEARVEVPPEMRAKSEPRLEYPRSAEPRPALTPAPREPAAVTPLPDVAPPRRSSMWIVAVLLLAILGVVGFGVWKFVLNKQPVTEPATVKTGTSEPVLTPQPVPVEPPPQVVAVPTSKLSLVKAPAVSVKMPANGVLQSVVADGTVVKEGDEVARLTGGKQLEQKISAAKGDLEKRYPADVTRLKAKLAAAPNNREAQLQLTNRENRIAQRTRELEELQGELAKLVVTAKSAGKVTMIAKAGTRLATAAEVASIEPDPYLSGAVDLGKPVTSQSGDPIEVKLKGNEATVAQCTLETVQGSKVSFRCPLTDGFADGVEVLVEAK